MAELIHLPRKDQPALKDLLDDFLDELRWSNRSLNTLRSYRLDLLDFLTGHPGLTVYELTPQLLRHYLTKVAAGGVAPNRGPAPRGPPLLLSLPRPGAPPPEEPL